MLKNKDIKIIGHRGAAGLTFENTIEGIYKAISFGVFGIEIDVWQTVDEEIIVFHDSYLDRLTNENGFISEMDYKTIRGIRLKNNDHIPTLNEVVKIVQENNVQLLVEIKSENAVEKVIDILSRGLHVSKFIVGSFYHKPIKELKEKNPEIQTSIMFESVPILLGDYLQAVNPDYVTVSIETFNDDLVNVVKSQGRKLIFYTVNTESELKLALKANPYAIVTNFPNLFV